MKNSSNPLIVYRTEDGKTSLEVKVESESVWLDAHQMAELFQVDRSGIIRHIQKIYSTKELFKSSTCAKNAQVAADGRTRHVGK